LVGIARDLLVRHGMGEKAIWINEMNASPNLDPNWLVTRPQFQVTLEQQASFLMQGAALGLASGVERMAVYKLVDQGLPTGAESFGILTPGSNAPRPAFYAWQTAAQHLTGVEAARLAASSTADVVRLTHSDGRQTTLAWAKTANATQIEISATGEKAVLLDQYGNKTLLRPVNGLYGLTLPAARCDEADGCAIGGAVSLLVQQGGAGGAEADVSEVSADGTRTALVFENES
jgi:hypothetical protein